MNDQATITADGARPWSTGLPEPRFGYEPVGYGRLLKLHAVNTLLTLVTLTVWRFWAVTRVRRVLWAHVRFDGEPAEYTGTGIEIFVGFLKVVLLILLPVALAVAALQIALLDASPGAGGFIELIYALGLLWFVALGKYLSLRYRTSRTRWRGIRGRLAGSVGGYLWLTFWTSALTVLTVGLFKPWMDALRIRYALDGARAGSVPVTCQLRGGSLFWSWLIAWLLASVTFGLSFFWYRARVYRLTADRTEIGPLRFGFTASGWRHAALWLGNTALLFGPGAAVVAASFPALLTTFGQMAETAGEINAMDWYRPLAGWIAAMAAAFLIPWILFMPIVWERRIRFLSRYLVVLGTLDVAAVRQAEEDETTAGEGLAGDFDAF